MKRKIILGSIVLALVLAFFLCGCGATAPTTESMPPPSPEATPSSDTTPSPVDSPSQSPSDSGIVVLNGGYNGGDFDLYLVDPSTGSSRLWKHFINIDGAKIYINKEFVTEPILAQRKFSPDYNKVVAMKNEDGSNHVGWITSEGLFVDVSSKVTVSESDFSNSINHTNPFFDENGLFYFTNGKTLMRVDPADLVPTSLISVETDPYSTYETLIEKCNLGLSANSVEYLVNSTTLIVDQGGYSQFFTVSQEDITQRYPLPQNNRCNFNPISSPDGKQIAFLSRATSEKYITATTNLFIVPFEGGDPVMVTSDYSFDFPRGTIDISYQLLDWI